MHSNNRKWTSAKRIDILDMLSMVPAWQPMSGCMHLPGPNLPPLRSSRGTWALIRIPRSTLRRNHGHSGCMCTMRSGTRTSGRWSPRQLPTLRVSGCLFLDPPLPASNTTDIPRILAGVILVPLFFWRFFIAYFVVWMGSHHFAYYTCMCSIETDQSGPGRFFEVVGTESVRKDSNLVSNWLKLQQRISKAGWWDYGSY